MTRRHVQPHRPLVSPPPGEHRPAVAVITPGIIPASGTIFPRRCAGVLKAARTHRIHAPVRRVPCCELRKAQPGFLLTTNRRETTTVTMRNTVLRFGYTFRDLDELVRILVTMDVWHLAWSGFERYEIAFSAMAVALYCAEEHPEQNDLFTAARKEITRKAQEDREPAGLPDNSGYETQVSFYRYWWEPCRHSLSPEDVAVDAMALRQIFPVLKPGYRRVLLALATHGEHQKAAGALGISRPACNGNLSEARQDECETENPVISARRDRSPESGLTPGSE